jgi:uncharacterized protein (DUF1800 family)
MPATDAQLSHLLRRTGVRVVPERLAQLRGLEISQAVEAVCDFSQNGQFQLAPKVSSDWEWRQSVANQFIDRLATLPNPLEAKLVLFWHGHFVSAISKVGSDAAIIEQYMKFHQLGSGPVEALAQTLAIDAAMLRYLDNDTNTKSAPNENFARELMELFLLGVNRGYTQTDVIESARAWTGYGLRWNGERDVYEFFPTRHDTGEKTIFGIKKAWNGPQLITEMCAGVRKRTTAEYLATKLWSFFAYENPDGALVSALADDFEAVGLETLSFLRRMFARPEFYSTQAMNGRVKSPLEWGATLIGALGLKSSDIGMAQYSNSAGQEFFNPPNVAGWKVNSPWLSESVLWALDKAGSHASWRAADDKALAAPTSRAVLQNAIVQPAADGVAAVANLFGLTLSDTSRTALENWHVTMKRDHGWLPPSALARMMALTTEARLA